jgi:hypothetical protein
MDTIKNQLRQALELYDGEDLEAAREKIVSLIDPEAVFSLSACRDRGTFPSADLMMQKYLILAEERLRCELGDWGLKAMFSLRFLVGNAINLC